MRIRIQIHNTGIQYSKTYQIVSKCGFPGSDICTTVVSPTRCYVQLCTPECAGNSVMAKLSFNKVFYYGILLYNGNIFRLEENATATGMHFLLLIYAPCTEDNFCLEENATATGMHFRV